MMPTTKHDRLVQRKRHWKHEMWKARQEFKRAATQYRGVVRDLLEEIEAMDAVEKGLK